MITEPTSHNYANHHLLDDQGDDYFAKTARDKALHLGDELGCPVALSLTQEPESGGRGAEAMTLRYGEILYWSGEVFDLFLSYGRADLLKSLTEPIKRLPGEPLGIHDTNWTPIKLEEYMLVTPALYALPRLVTLLTHSDKLTKDRSVFLALDTLETCTLRSHTINELMIHFANSIISFGIDKNQVLKNLLSRGKLGEDNCYTAYREILREIRRRSSFLWQIYQDLSYSEKSALGLANLAL